jgi:hypothetical protein
MVFNERCMGVMEKVVPSPASARIYVSGVCFYYVLIPEANNEKYSTALLRDGKPP